MKLTSTHISRFTRRAVVAICLLSPLTACEDFVTIDPPRTELVKVTVFEADDTALAAMMDIYYNMTFSGFASGDVTSLSYLGAISGDEMIDYTANSIRDITQPFYTHTLTPANGGIELSWNKLYALIYKANAVLEGLAASGDNLTPALRTQLEGEAKLIRAFCHFYLVNLWGTVPLVTSTDYQANTANAGNYDTDIYTQITLDLRDAQELLPSDYSVSGNLRTRPNRSAAAALLARAYLYTGDWPNAELEASKVIDNELYSLETNLADVFTKTSSEVLWQLEPYQDYPPDILTFYVFGTPPTWGALRPGFKEKFTDNDLRKTQWIGTIADTETYDFPIKYQSFAPRTEYSTVIRLAELYLIRAEARTHLQNYAGAQQDVNAIRNRAGLDDTDLTAEALLEEVMKQRELELFCEWGHRWLDLKRTGAVDAVLTPIKPGWKSEYALFPIPEFQVLNSPVKQNPGY